MAVQSQISFSETIKELDQKLLELLAERIVLLAKQPNYEEHTQHFDQLSGLIPGICPSDRLGDWLRHTASLSARQAWPNQTVVYLGPVYSFSYLAAVRFFGLGADLHPVASIGAAFEEIVRKQAAFAVVPIENSTDGRVVDTLGRFARTPVQICGEVQLPIHHCLLGSGVRADICEVHSKPQALSQCRDWLAEHLPDARLVEVASTAMAAASASANKSVAAIASREAAVHYGCRVIVENIEDNAQNVTRFAVIGDRSHEPTGHDKTSLMFELSHQPGALADTMLVFKNAQVNLTWIESFPLPNRPSEYLFFVELEGHQKLPSVQLAVDGLRAITKRLDVLGSYPRG